MIFAILVLWSVVHLLHCLALNSQGFTVLHQSKCSHNTHELQILVIVRIRLHLKRHRDVT